MCMVCGSRHYSRSCRYLLTNSPLVAIPPGHLNMHIPTGVFTTCPEHPTDVFKAVFLAEKSGPLIFLEDLNVEPACSRLFLF